MEQYHAFIQHDTDKAENLPDQFRADHDGRYLSAVAMPPAGLVDDLRVLMTLDLDQRPYIVGAVPNFDTERLARLFHHHGVEIPWHYHLIDVENLALGHVAAMAKEYPGSTSADFDTRAVPPIDSEALSRACGVDPNLFERHTALGDVLWAMAIYDAVMGGTP
jgi:hypothetical protein